MFQDLSILFLLFVFVEVSAAQENINTWRTWSLGRKPDIGISYGNFVQHRFTYLDADKVLVTLVLGASDCGLSCVINSRCISYNIAATPESSGKFRCELLSSDKYRAPGNFTSSSTFHHYSLETPCLRNPCGHNEACVPDYERGTFKCICKTGFSGPSCVVRLFSANFTNLGASGREGPSSLGSHYSGKPHEHQVTLSSGIQLWTVPYTGRYRIDAVGATGGYDNKDNAILYRGRGARMRGTFTFTKGENLKILVGQEGGKNVVSSSGGGGGTFVVRGSNTPLIIAGGGGGIESASTRHSECDGSQDLAGNRGYGGKAWAGGSNGYGATTADTGNSGGGGGGLYTNGRSSTHFGGTTGNGGEGGKGFLQGGTGGRALSNNAFGGFGGGGGAYGNGGGAGGGGGYSGGASGDNVINSCGGGGGSFNGGENQENACCFNNNGHGFVNIDFLG